MKKIYFCIIILFSCIYMNANNVEIRVASYNMRNDNEGDVRNGNGIENSISSSQLKVYPNPTTSYLNVDCPQAGRLFVYNSFEKKINVATVGNGITDLNVTNYHSVIYFVNVITKEGNYFGKFLKK